METIRVLHIECDPGTRKLVSDLLNNCQHDHYIVDSTYYLRDAIDELKRNHYDVIISNLMVADNSGHNILQSLTVLKQPPPIIFVSRGITVALAKEMVSFGAQSLLSLETINTTNLCTEIQLSIKRQNIVQEIRDIALRDDLTGLYNRRGFKQFAKQQLEISKKTKQECSLIFVDLDNLKLINDTGGHKLGDDAIKALASCIEDSVRASDIVGRLGGDEFVIMAPNTDERGAQKLTTRIRSCMVVHNTSQQVLFYVNASIGFAVYDGKSDITLDTLQDEACSAMYVEKKGKPYARSSTAITNSN